MKYNFIPLNKKQRFVRGYITISLSKSGVLRFSKEFQRVYMPEKMLVRLLVDEEKRTIGIQIEKEIKVIKEEVRQWRMISINKKTGVASVGARNLVTAFGIKESMLGLSIEEITDTIYGKLIIFKLSIT